VDIELYENLKNGATVSSAFTFNYYIASKQIFSFGVVIKIYLSYLYIFHGVMPLISFRLKDNGPEEAKT